MFCHFCYETVEHVCSAKDMPSPEQKEWWEDWRYWEKLDNDFPRPLLPEIVAEATRRARAEMLREVEEMVDKIERFRPGRSYDIEDMRAGIQAMKGEGV